MKIYTRKGDSGETSLFGGKRVGKDDLRVEAYVPDDVQDWRAALVDVQSDCFTIGAMLATPKTGAAKPEHIPELSQRRIEDIEDGIDRLDEELEPLESFVLPGGSISAAALHLARSVCRRAERQVVALGQSAEIEPLRNHDDRTPALRTR